MEEQAEGLREYLGLDEQSQLAEVYSELDKESEAEKQELEELRTELKQINKLLDSYGVPKVDNKMKLSAIERIELAMKIRLYA